jgi:hypothetical protein
MGPDLDPDPVVTGNWSGSTGGISLNRTLVEDEAGGVSGSGIISSALAAVEIVVRLGAHSYPNLSLILGAVEIEDFNYTGQLVSATLLSGEITGGGLFDVDISLLKNEGR